METPVSIDENDPESMDMALRVHLFGLPDLEGDTLVYEKDAEPHGWITKGRVKTTDYDCDGWEVVNIYSGDLEFVKPHEVHEVESDG
jgi:hypothetical protein